MDLKFIIQQLPYADHITDDVIIAQGYHKMITNWKEAKQQIKWQFRKKLK